MGVWIETVRSERSGRNCGVTPYVGVWIETLKRVKGEQGAIVTPYVGVWIETEMPARDLTHWGSLLMWECGLKLLYRSPTRRCEAVTPYVGVWIETL